MISRLDRYMLERTLAPLSAAVAIALVALLMERMVRLLELLVNQGGPLLTVVKMLGNLIPHYLGLALPLALFLGVLLTATRISVDSELDAMQSAGVGLRRLLAPLMALTVAIAATVFLLSGWLQPYTRYGYRALVYAATNSAWDLALERGSFFSGIGDSTILIDDIASGGRVLKRVFIYQDHANGDISVMTAERGEAFRLPEEYQVLLKLENGRRVEIAARNEKPNILAFEKFDLPLEIKEVAPFRDRAGEREMTLPELFDGARDPALYPGVRRSRIVSEIHGRVVRTLSILFLPLLAVPLGLSQRRSQRGVGLVFGVLLLALYNYVLQFGETAADKDRLTPWIGLWLPLAAMFAFSLWSFWTVSARPRDNYLVALFGGIERGQIGLRALFARRRNGEP